MLRLHWCNRSIMYSVARVQWEGAKVLVVDDDGGNPSASPAPLAPE